MLFEDYFISTAQEYLNQYLSFLQENEVSYTCGQVFAVVSLLRLIEQTFNSDLISELCSKIQKICGSSQIPFILRSALGSKNEMQTPDGNFVSLPGRDSDVVSLISFGISLSNLMQDLGYRCSGSNTYKKLLEYVGISVDNGPGCMNNEDFARVLGMMIRTHSGLEEPPSLEDTWNSTFQADFSETDSLQSWDVENVTVSLFEVNPKLDWLEICRNLDQKEFIFFDAPAIALILTSFKVSAMDFFTFPTQAFFGIWKNVKTQLSFIKQAIQTVPDLFTLNQSVTRRVVSVDPTLTHVTTRSMIQNLSNQPWNSLDVLDTLIFLSEGEVQEEARALLEFASQHAPEVVALGLSQMKEPWSQAHKDLSNSVITMFMLGHPSSSFVLPRIWQNTPKLTVKVLLAMYNKDPTSLSRILDISQDLKALTQILESKPYSFSIDLAALASRRDYLNLEKWLQDHIRVEGDIFVKACLDFLSEKTSAQISRLDASLHQSVPLSTNVAETFVKILQSNSATMSEENLDYFKEISMLQTVAPSSEDANPTSTIFSPDIEEESLTYYGRMYNSEISIQTMLEMFEKFKKSENQREQELFKCMVQSMFEEYNSFANHPVHILVGITAVLFGQLIQHNILVGQMLGHALRCILDSLRLPIDSKIFKFGTTALQQFQNRLTEWPHYCTLLTQITNFQQAMPELYSIIHLKASNSQTQGDIIASNTVVTNTNETNDVKSTVVFTSLKLDTLLDAAEIDMYEIPAEAIQDRIFFIVNNITEDNLDKKVPEMKEMLKDEHLRWFSHYLVVKRATIEPNYHGVYLKFLENFQNSVLDRLILHETYANIKVLLNSEKTNNMSSERVLLKNLGVWLGSITLASNKPIKHKNLAFVELLVEGFDNNRMIVVIPFVCKVLEKCAESKIFKPPNPWLMSIMKVLMELYLFCDLKAPLQFPIDVLCKTLNLNLKEIEPSNIFRNRQPRDSNISAIGLETPLQSAMSVTINSPKVLANSISEEANSNIPNIAPHIMFNSNIPVFNSHPAAKRIVYIAIDRAIREIIGPVVERSVTIAAIAARELVLKDFALEPNEEKMRRAAQLMVSSLSGSLASVTGREPLRISMITHLKTLLQQNGFTEQTIPEQAISIMVNDNLELACTVLEQRASEKAVPEIEESLQNAYKSRKLHRERSSQPFYDVAIYSASRYPSTLPESLRLKPGGLTTQQFRVYEDFGARPSRNTAPSDIAERTRTLSTGRVDQRVDSAAATYGFQQLASASGLEDQQSVQYNRNIAQTAERLTSLIGKLEEILIANPTANLASIQQQNDIFIIIRQIPVLVSQSYNRDDAALLITQKIVQILHKNDVPFACEVLVLLLEKLTELSKRVAKEVGSWLLYSEDERKYNVAITMAFIQTRLVNVTELDMQLARLIESERPGLSEFTANLLRRCILDDIPVANQNDFFNCIDLLSRSTKRGSVPEVVSALLEDLRKKSTIITTKDISSVKNEASGLRDQLAVLFTEWVQLYSHPASNEKSQASFVHRLQLQGILKGEEVSYLFFRVCTEMSVDNFIKLKVSNTHPSLVYQAVDAFARLIVLLVRYYSDSGSPNASNNQIKLTTNILSIVVLVLVHSHEQHRASFNQRPFLRLFSTLLTDLCTYEEQLQPIYFQILSAISNTFHSLQPIFLPGFTFAWLQLVSHRYFMPKLLMPENQKGWPFFQRLMVDLFKFLQPYLRQGELSEPIRLLYKGTLRILLILLHDVPEFLCDYHFSFVDVIPHNCIQLRNLILSAFPHNMKLPDPFTPDLKVDLLPEIHQAPHVLSDVTFALLANNVKQEIDMFLKAKGPSSFLVDLRSRLENTTHQQIETGFKYNVPVINALVLYVGVQAISQQPMINKQGNSNAIRLTPHMEIFQHMVLNLDAEGLFLRTFCSFFLQEFRSILFLECNRKSVALS
ncbi:hypothetical protein HK096_005081 [Nowakowskiella sp. JEL0078]|nr:hypothetical protein HK096_005081 [Nowakowskiella sp. JEL0078]